MRPIRTANSERITDTMTQSANTIQKFTRAELVARLVRAGELEVSGEDGNRPAPAVTAEKEALRR
jgi:hypothetical protein